MKEQKNNNKENKPIEKIISSVKKIAGYLCSRGWAEKNAGNISVNVSEQLVISLDILIDFPEIKLSKPLPELHNELILITSSGSRMRDLLKNPAENSIILAFNEKGDGYRQVSLDRISKYKIKNKKQLFPTSELSTHLLLHQWFEKNKMKEKAVLHTHPTELIALTHIPEYKTTAKINRLIFSMHPETKLLLPEGIGFVKFTKPGTDEIGLKTLSALKKYKTAVWEKHGCFAVGEDIDEAFDYVDIVVKAVKIFFLCRSIGCKPEGINLKELN